MSGVVVPLPGTGPGLGGFAVRRRARQRATSAAAGAPGRHRPPGPGGWWQRLCRWARSWLDSWPRPSSSGSVVLVVAAVVTVGVTLTPLLSAAGLVCLVWWWRRRVAAVAAARQAQLPEALQRMAGALRTGSSMPQALAEVARTFEPPLGPELARLAQATARGRSLLPVVDEWAAASTDQATRLVATAIVLAATVGAAPARALDGVASTLRERLDLSAERRALSAQARLSTFVLAAAPVLGAVLFGSFDPAIGGFLTGSPLGFACLVVGLGLDVLGLVWMQRIARAVQR